MKEKDLVCAFCGKPKELAKRLVSGPNGTFICDECIEICKEVLAEEEGDFEEEEEEEIIEEEDDDDFDIPNIDQSDFEDEEEDDLEEDEEDEEDF